jgi:GAF domain-containing protein
MGGLVRGKKGKPASKASQRVRGRVSDRPRRKSSNDGKLARALAEAAEARAHQAATAEILRVIARSPSDVQPVFDAIVKSALMLCKGIYANAFRYDGERLHFMANETATEGFAASGSDPAKLRQQVLEGMKSKYPMRPDRSQASGRAVLTNSIARVEDIAHDPDYEPRFVVEGGPRRMLGVPMQKDGAAIGVIVVAWDTPGSIHPQHEALLRAFADQAVIAIENVRLFNETKEALERQTATAEILRVISRSPTDIQPVLDAVAESAARLCEAADCSIFRLDDDRLVLAAHHGPITAPAPIGEFSISLRRESVAGRTVLDARTVHVADIHAAADEYPSTFEATRSMGFRTMLNVPLIREGVAIGVIQLPRTEVRPFTDRQIALLETFADQAVIAIENVRLFNETKEALERQTATADVLQAISGSISDASPVFERILESTERLIACRSAAIFLYPIDGQVHCVAVRGQASAEVRAMFPVPLDENSLAHAVMLGRRQITYSNVLHDADVPATLREIAVRTGDHAIAATPLMWEGGVIGHLSVVREANATFNEKELGLLRTFASQAVIAIQNARLFNETKEALERQTATAEILKVISESPTDTQPVFDVIAERAMHLCGADISLVETYGGGAFIDLRAAHGLDTSGLEAARSGFPMPIESQTVSAGVVRSRDTVHMPDVLADTAYLHKELATAMRYRGALGVPMLRGKDIIGVIFVARRNPGLFSEREIALVKTFADQAVIAIENVRLFNETKEALERQTATAEILKVISESPTDTQPVLEAIAESAARLFGSWNAGVLIREDKLIHLRAARGPALGDQAKIQAMFPIPFDPDSVLSARAIASGCFLEFPDTEGPDIPSLARDLARAGGHRALAYMPLLREGRGIGAIVMLSPNPGSRFSEHQVSLLRTFADQAVIAIENVRLFNETKEALERQTATAEILEVMSRSQTDLQPVFDTISASALRLCDGDQGLVFTYDGEQIHVASTKALTSEEDSVVRAAFPVPPDRGSITGRAILTRALVQVADVLEDPEYTFTEQARSGGFRSILSVPMLRAGVPIGAISVHRREPTLFSEHQVALVKTFADQAVIAVENVRLFNETNEALERQTATAEILKVISESPTDVQPVFDAIVQSCMRLFGGMQVALNMAHGDVIDRVAYSAAQETVDATANVFPMPLNEASIAGRAMLRGELVHLEDLSATDWISEGPLSIFLRTGHRSALCVPMLREGKAIGAIIVFGQTTGRFKDEQIALLNTFADQAVIAIENVRLFKELQTRTEALTKSVGQLTALGEVGQAISSTLDLEKVLPTIVARAVQLTGLDGGAIYEYDEQRRIFNLRGGENIMPELVELYRNEPIRLGEGAVGGAAAERAPVQIADILAQGYESRARGVLERAGARALLAVPLLSEGRILGALAVIRNTPGEFPPEVVKLLETFGTQSAIAIQNARLFREIEEKGRELEIASQHKSQFLASMSHELRTPLNAILGFNEMMLDGLCGDVPEGFQDPLQETQTSGKHLLRLINNVLDLAKIEAGRMELALADYAVQDMVESVRSTLRPLAEAKGLAFNVALPNDLPLAHGDAGRLTQCLMNLAGNALKFTKQGQVAISVEAQDDRLLFRVTDTGIGIPPEKIDSLFTEFKQTDATIASEYGGTGLGLAITRQFIEMHGGRIWVESEPGKGSTFIFEIPLRARAT